MAFLIPIVGEFEIPNAFFKQQVQLMLKMHMMPWRNVFVF